MQFKKIDVLNNIVACSEVIRLYYSPTTLGTGELQNNFDDELLHKSASITASHVRKSHVITPNKLWYRRSSE